MSYAHLFENCDHVIESNILLDIASIPPVLKKALIFLIQSGLEREAFNAQLTELLILPQPNCQPTCLLRETPECGSLSLPCFNFTTC